MFIVILHDWPWIGFWNKLISSELDIIFNVRMSKLLDRLIHCIVDCDVISYMQTEHMRYRIDVWRLLFNVMTGIVMLCMKRNNVYIVRITAYVVYYFWAFHKYAHKQFTIQSILYNVLLSNIFYVDSKILYHITQKCSPTLFYFSG